MISSSHFHPMLVHFPIALITFGFLADLFSLFFKKEACLSRSGFYLLITGTIGALLAWATGMFFTAEMSGSAGEMRETHELFATITLGLLVLASVLRIVLIKKPDLVTMKWVAFVLYCLAVFFVSITGYFGGNLVYNYMMPI
ncbi:MAG TPA: DUF2231 domain-containing protein [Bacteroidales bacterium]|nr:DUF2231 domain-containing protein [Bacteroidales bacterium]